MGERISDHNGNGVHGLFNAELTEITEAAGRPAFGRLTGRDEPGITSAGAFMWHL
jgi:hypothetical protein